MSVPAPDPTLSYPMPQYMYTFSSQSPTSPVRPKRRQVKNACTNCQKACKKCDDARPCLRCVRYGISEECVDSQRKQRKKGIKRGPYKKRDGRDRTVRTLDTTGQQHLNPAALTAAPHPFVSPDCYGQYTHYTPKSDDTPPYPYPYYFTQMPHDDITLMGQGDKAADNYSQSISYYPIFPFQPSYPTLNFSSPYVIPEPIYRPL